MSNNSGIYLSGLCCQEAPYFFEQSDILAFMLRETGADEALRRHMTLLYRATGIRRRGSFLEDFGMLHPTFFSTRPRIDARMRRYFEAVLPAARQAAARSIEESGLQTKDITHLITVSCTGMAAPGLDLQLMKVLGLPAHTQRTAVHFMGCYAAFHAWRMAKAFALQSPRHRVLIVDAEFCSLHFTPSTEADHLLANALFADGVAACVVSAHPHHAQIELLDFQSLYLPQGEDDMAWHIGQDSFLMRLSSYVPDLVEAGIPALLRLYDGLSREKIDYWAIHPGGKRILQAVEKALNLPQDSLAVSYEVLRNYGNMSSVTIFFVLQQLLRRKARGNCWAAGFGPGLTLESALLRLL